MQLKFVNVILVIAIPLMAQLALATALSAAPVSAPAPAKKLAINAPAPKTIAQAYKFESPEANQPSLVFDIPLAYNSEVRKWIRYYQTAGRGNYKKCLERSNRYLPAIQKILKDEGVPRDMAYMAMIESCFSSQAVSSAQAVGPWQFVEETGQRYGLHISDWLDERRDFDKSSHAAAKYLKFLFANFRAWHLVAAGYNTGENRIARLVRRHNSRNFWTLSERGLSEETRNYVPKLIAAVLIAKAPNLYGFRDLQLDDPIEYESLVVPGGTQLADLADTIGVTHQMMKELNPDLIHGAVPYRIHNHAIHVPSGAAVVLTRYFQRSLARNFE